MATGGVSPDNSLVLGPEDIDGLQCQPCYLDGDTAEVVGMCLTCQEFLCQSCFDGHKRPKPCRNHDLLKKDQMLKKHVSLARRSTILRDMTVITVKTDEDSETPIITGMILLPDKRLLIADYSNQKLKMVDVNKCELIKEYGMPWSSPQDIILIKDQQIAVSMPEDAEVAFFNMKGSTIIFDRFMMVNGECSSIDYRDGKLAVAYNALDYVEVLNLQGDCLYTIQLGKIPKTFFGPYITFNMDGTSLYVSNHRDTHVIRQYSLTGRVMSTYRNEYLQHVNKVITDSSGNVYFCDPILALVHKLSSDLKHAEVVAEYDLGFFRPWIESLCYNESKGDFYYGGAADEVRVCEKEIS